MDDESVLDCIKDLTGDNTTDYMNAIYCILPYKSLDDIDCETGSLVPYDEGYSKDDVYDSAEYSMLKDQLNEVLATLTDREQEVLRLRFGLDDGRQRTLEEVGEQFNVTRERIRQLEAKALRKLRHPTRSKRLRDFLD